MLSVHASDLAYQTNRLADVAIRQRSQLIAFYSLAAHGMQGCNPNVRLLASLRESLLSSEPLANNIAGYAAPCLLWGCFLRENRR